MRGAAGRGQRGRNVPRRGLHHDIRKIQPAQLIAGIAEHPAGRRIGIDKMDPGTGQQDANIRLLKEIEETGVARARLHMQIQLFEVRHSKWPGVQRRSREHSPVERRMEAGSPTPISVNARRVPGQPRSPIDGVDACYSFLTTLSSSRRRGIALLGE
jgi:hypothetical protein